MTEHLITRWISGSSDEISIDERRYNEICTAKDGIMLSLELEERLAVVLENYHEFEVEVFSHGLRWAMHEDWRWKSRRDQVFTLNRRLLSFLNAIWMYRDHVKGEIRRRPSVTPELRQELTEKLQDTFSSKSLLAALLLRNHCQHQTLGLEGVGVTNAWYKLQRRVPSSSQEERLITSAVLAVKVSDLSLRDKSTRAILEDLRANKVEMWDPGPDLRKAIDSLTQFHSELRQVLSKRLEAWQEHLAEIVKNYTTTFGTTIGLCVIERYDRGRYGQPVEIFPEFLERVKELQDRNGGATALENRIVTMAPPIRST